MRKNYKAKVQIVTLRKLLNLSGSLYVKISKDKSMVITSALKIGFVR